MSNTLVSKPSLSAHSLAASSQRGKTAAVSVVLGLIMLSMGACAKEDTASSTEPTATVIAADAPQADASVTAQPVAQANDASIAASNGTAAADVASPATDATVTTTTTAGASTAAVVPATGAPAVEGKEYLVLKKPLSTSAPAGKVEVLEFFWYRCPHCHEFEPSLKKWAQQMGDTIVFKRVPVYFGRSGMEEEQRLYYTLEAMNLTDSLHEKLFNDIHNKRMNLSSQENMADWMEKQGVNRAAFEKAFQSFGVSTKAKQAQKIQDKYMVDGVPALAVNGTYYTSPSIAGSIPRALEVSTQLVQKSKQ